MPSHACSRPSLWGDLPHGLWPSGVGSIIAAGLENANAVALIATATSTVKTTNASGQAPQSITYISNALPAGDGMSDLEPLGEAAKAGHLTMGSISKSDVLTSVTVNNQGLVNVIQAAVTGLDAKQPYFLPTSTRADGSGVLTPIAKFMSNPAGAAIVGAVGALRSVLDGRASGGRSYLVVASEQDGKPGQALQVSY